MSTRCQRFLLIVLLSTSVVTAEASAEWKTLATGMEIGTFTASQASPVGDSRITVLRIDPKSWELVLIGKSWNDEATNKSARDWCKTHDLTAAINAGMFATDFTTHVGYLGTEEHVNSSQVNKYLSVAAFDPRQGEGIPEFRIFDLDDPNVTMEGILADYSSVVQNLRLIKRPGENRWSRQSKKWSEAALGEDGAGRVLFIFVRSPFSMHDLNRELLSLGIDLVAAQHLEGGPEAQLFLRIGDVTREMFGSFETSFQEDDDNPYPWTIPNIIGVRPRF